MPASRFRGQISLGNETASRLLQSLRELFQQKLAFDFPAVWRSTILLHKVKMLNAMGLVVEISVRCKNLSYTHQVKAERGILNALLKKIPELFGLVQATHVMLFCRCNARWTRHRQCEPQRARSSRRPLEKFVQRIGSGNDWPG